MLNRQWLFETPLVAPPVFLGSGLRLRMKRGFLGSFLDELLVDWDGWSPIISVVIVVDLVHSAGDGVSTESFLVLAM